MIPAHQRDEAFLADVRSVSWNSESLRLWWLGQSGFLLGWRGRFLLFDPYLSDSLTVKYAQTDKPHVRMTERVIAPERLYFVNVITSSHNHTDHLDAETIIPLRRANPDAAIVVPTANGAFAAERLDLPPGDLAGLNAGETLEVNPFSIAGVPAAHETVETDDEGNHKYMGYVVQCGDWHIYHSGDTVLYPGMEDTLRPHRIDVALLPINGTAPERRVAGNLNGAEAAQLGRAIGARCVIPCHYEMFEFNTASPDLFVSEAERLGQPYAILRAGEGWINEKR